MLSSNLGADGKGVNCVTWLLGCAAIVQEERYGKPQLGGPFTLVDQSGKERSLSDFRGKFVLIYFGKHSYVAF